MSPGLIRICMDFLFASGGSYDFITVGAFAAHNKGFKQGGLNRMFKASSTNGRIPAQDKLQSLVGTKFY